MTIQPTLIIWHLNTADGKITAAGLLHHDGTQLETSPIIDCDPIAGVITTVSGSTYHLGTHVSGTTEMRARTIASLFRVLRAADQAGNP